MSLLHNWRAGLYLSGWSMAGLVPNLMLAAITLYQIVWPGVSSAARSCCMLDTCNMNVQVMILASALR